MHKLLELNSCNCESNSWNDVHLLKFRWTSGFHFQPVTVSLWMFFLLVIFLPAFSDNEQKWCEHFLSLLLCDRLGIIRFCHLFVIKQAFSRIYIQQDARTSHRAQQGESSKFAWRICKDLLVQPRNRCARSKINLLRYVTSFFHAALVAAGVRIE